MKYLISVILALSILFPMKIKSQNQELSLEDLIPGGKTYRKYTPQMPQGLAWYGDQLTYQKGDSILFVESAKGTKPKTFVTLEEINSSLGLKVKLKSLSAVTLGNTTRTLFVYTANNISIYDMPLKKEVAAFKSSSDISNQDISEQSFLMAYTKQNNLYIQDAKGNETVITEEGNPKIVCGQSVHQNEFGISKGTFWSPQGHLLATKMYL